MERAESTFPRLGNGELAELASHPRAFDGAVDARTLSQLTASADVAEIARVDRQIESLLQQVTVPEDLSDRVLARLRERANAISAPRRMGKWAVGMVAAAAALLLCASVPTFLPRPLDSDAVVASAAPIHDLVTQSNSDLMPGLGDGPWPQIMDPATCLGFRRVALFGQTVTAYRLAAGNTTAVLIVMPKRDFPYSVGPDRVGFKDSTHGIDVYCFVADGQACVLMVRDGVDPSRFELPTALT